MSRTLLTARPLISKADGGFNKAAAKKTAHELGLKYKDETVEGNPCFHLD